MRKFLSIAVIILIISLFSSCVDIFFGPYPKGAWECDKLKAYFWEDSENNYCGYILENGKPLKFQVLFTNYDTTCCFVMDGYYVDEAFLNGRFTIHNGKLIIRAFDNHEYVFLPISISKT